jgi:hypothetical protein
MLLQLRKLIRQLSRFLLMIHQRLLKMLYNLLLVGALFLALFQLLSNLDNIVVLSIETRLYL